MATAVIFPGQGSQTDDMRERVAALRPDLLAAVTEAVGEDPFPRVGESTRYAQPAIFAASLALWGGREPAAVELMAGHSLGELSALVAAGTLAEADGVRLVALRGKLMGEASAGGMVALLGAGAAEHAAAIAAATGTSLANDNSPGQVVLSGHRERLPAVVSAAGDAGLRAMELPVTGAFHSPLMADAVAPFAAALAEVAWRPPRCVVVSAVTAEPFDDPARRLAEALTGPVRWREVMLELVRRGATRFIEPGPGRILLGLAKRTVTGVELVGG